VVQTLNRGKPLPQDDDEMLSEEDEEPEVAMSMFDLADLLAGKEATVINVPHDMNIEQAIAAFGEIIHDAVFLFGVHNGSHFRRLMRDSGALERKLAGVLQILESGGILALVPLAEFRV